MLVGRPDDALNKGFPYTTIRRILNPHAGVSWDWDYNLIYHWWGPMTM